MTEQAISTTAKKLIGVNIFTGDIGKAGSEYAQQTPDASGQYSGIAKATADAGISGANNMMMNNISGQINHAADVYENRVEQDYIEKQRVSLTSQLDAVKKGLQLENVKGAFTPAALNDPNVYAAKEELDSIKALREQGYANNIAVQLRTEAIMKKYINQAPAFTQEIRKLAYEVLGYDPTGAQIQALMGNGSKAQLTPEQEGINNAKKKYAERVANYQLVYGDTQQKAQVRVLEEDTTAAKQHATELRLKSNDLIVSDGHQLTSEVVTYLDNNVLNNVLNVPDPKNPGQSLFGGIMKLYAAQGGLREDEKRDFLGKIDMEKQRTINNTLAMLPAGVSLADKDMVQKHIEQRFTEVTNMVNNGDLEKIYKATLNRMTDGDKIDTFTKFPELLTISNLSGSGGVINSIDVMNKWEHLSEEARKNLAPGAAAILDIVKAKRIGKDTLLQNAQGKVPTYNTPEEKRYAAQTGLWSLLSKDLTDDQKNIAFKTALANQSPMNVLRWFNSLSGEQAVRGSKLIRSQFRNHFVSELNAVVEDAHINIADIEKETGAKITIDPKTGKIASNLKSEAFYELKKDSLYKRLLTNIGERALSPPLETIFGLIDRHFDSLGIKDTAAYKKELIAEIMTKQEEAKPVQEGNIDLNNRPVVKNNDGTISTVRSITIGTDKGFVLIPTVVGNKVVSNKEAIEHYKKTGKHLGVFKTQEEADAYAQQLHEAQAKSYTVEDNGEGVLEVSVK